MAFVEIEEDEYVPKGQFLKMRDVFAKIFREQGSVRGD